MKLLKLSSVIAVALLPSFASAHSMQPGFETELSATPEYVKTYELTNEYPHPAVYEIKVYEKDWTPAEGWKSKKPFYKLFPDSTAQVKIKFKVGAQRKLYVCSLLTEIDIHGTKASMISRVCSRLIINPMWLVDDLVDDQVNPKVEKEEINSN